ncbi:hypothetical protein R6242_07145 [Iodobacter sp. CM08]|uniref:hypothetical protein n=1 Tax=Iodobacter sp. CM08 TaxID=3085902 RepID=UPI0029815639|nr:hypothetical protein [Iodobacter sp. CM08]MDW5416347.1 hypothetical protein [Iodobacter sp. CM08]
MEKYVDDVHVLAQSNSILSDADLNSKSTDDIEIPEDGDIPQEMLDLVEAGYIVIHPDRNVSITQKYRDHVLTNPHADDLGEERVVSFVGENTIVFSENTTSNAAGNVNKITWHWWGYQIYLSSASVYILDGLINNSSTGLMNDYLGSYLPTALSYAVALYIFYHQVALHVANQHRKGVILKYIWGVPAGFRSQ